MLENEGIISRGPHVLFALDIKPPQTGHDINIGCVISITHYLIKLIK